MSNILEKFDLHGKTAVVTGGSGLLGRQFSLALAQAGANILVADLAQQAAEAHALNLREQGLRAEGFGVDVTDPASTQAMARAAQEIFGGLDILVNSAALDPKFDPANASSQGANAFESYSLDSWRQALDVNLTGMFLTTQAFMPLIKATGKGGSIVNIGSIQGMIGPSYELYEGTAMGDLPPDYFFHKGGMMNLTRYYAASLGRAGVRVNCLSPGGFLAGQPEAFVEAYSRQTYLGRMGQSTDLGGAVVFLLSEASAYITGANLPVDGGYTAH